MALFRRIMLISHLQGGLGNQMFQYALGRVLSLKNETPFFVDLNFYLQNQPDTITERAYELDIFNTACQKAAPALVNSFLKESTLNRISRTLHLPYKKIVLEKNFSFQSSVLSSQPPVYLKGFWQSERYFQESTDTIRKDFTFLPPADVETEKIAAEIQQLPSVAIHVRRGDFLSPNNRVLHRACSVAYYKSGIRYLEEKLGDLQYYLFTDDPEWVSRELLDPQKRMRLVTHNKGLNNWKDMYLMSLCNHQIIANSSFSWWGAWLNRHAGKLVIAPKKWFFSDDPFWNYTDVVPGGWVRLDNE